MERITDKFDDEIKHIAMKTGLKTWHVIAALVGKTITYFSAFIKGRNRIIAARAAMLQYLSRTKKAHSSVCQKSSYIENSNGNLL